MTVLGSMLEFTSVVYIDYFKFPFGYIIGLIIFLIFIDITIDKKEKKSKRLMIYMALI